MPKPSSKNFFAALESDDENDQRPSFALGPSILARAVPLQGTAEQFSRDDEAESATGSKLPYALPQPLEGSSTSLLNTKHNDLDLAAVTAELDATAAGIGPSAAWDFSGLTSSTLDAAQVAARDAARLVEAQLVAEARIAALESDKTLLRERLDRTEQSRRQRQRRGAGLQKAEAASGKLLVKAGKKEAALRRRNVAKHTY